ncbi:MAG: Slp family lipoprotein [Xanthomonadaceae bacterium]|nr:Slp family lipoprotein [Xanthomonadaceae bacterium]
MVLKDNIRALQEPGRTGAEVIWGGRIVGIVNSAEHTELEVLALPLRSGHRPRRDAEGGVRFVIRMPGFLEPMNYSPGRYVTALGRYVGIESRSVGSFNVDHPVLEGRQLELWPVDPNRRNTRFSLGVGVRL